mgnify:CR=1 FL=1
MNFNVRPTPQIPELLLTDDKQALIGDLISGADGYNRMPSPYLSVIVWIPTHRCVNCQYNKVGSDLPFPTGKSREKLSDPRYVSAVWNIKSNVRDFIPCPRLFIAGCHVLKRNSSSFERHLVFPLIAMERAS